MDTADSVLAHIEHKARSRELAPEVAQRMRDALDAGAAPDYAQLLEAATFLPPPAVVFHTAPSEARTAIETGGLLPGDERNWTRAQRLASQPVGVYVGPEPDVRGIWSHWDSWDVWAIQVTGLPWVHDRLNPGCWSIPITVPPRALTLHGTFTW